MNLILNFIFIPLFFQDAAAMTTNIAEFTTMIICAYYAKGLVVVEDRRKMIMAIALGCIFIFGVCILLKYLCSTYYIILLVAVPISIAGYFVIQAVMKNWVVKDILKLMRNKIRG